MKEDQLIELAEWVKNHIDLITDMGWKFKENTITYSQTLDVYAVLFTKHESSLIGIGKSELEAFRDVFLKIIKQENKYSSLEAFLEDGNRTNKIYMLKRNKDEK